MLKLIHPIEVKKSSTITHFIVYFNKCIIIVHKIENNGEYLFPYDNFTQDNEHGKAIIKAIEEYEEEIK